MSSRRPRSRKNENDGAPAELVSDVAPAEAPDEASPPPPPAEQSIAATPIVALGETVSPTEAEQISVTQLGIRRSSIPPPAPRAPDEPANGPAEDTIEEIEAEPEPEPEPEASQEAALADDPREAKTPAEGVPAVRSSDPAAATAATEPVPDRASDNPPEVEPEDLEIHEIQPARPPPVSVPPRRSPTPPPTAPATPPAAVAAPAPLPLTPTRGPDSAAVVQFATAPPTSRRRPRYWWDELFGDDFLRTMERLSDAQIRAEATFIEESLSVQKGGIILDLGCGTGRHAVELASRGYNIVGFDLSLAMLARAADEAQDRGQKLNFLQGDMRDMGFEEMFDGVYCWSTSFGYFDDDKNMVVAHNIHKALRPSGMLLLDVANRDFLAANQPSNVWFEGDSCVCMDEMRVDFIASRLRVKRMVMLDDGRSRELEYSIRLYSLHELGRLLHDVGFKVTEVSGHPATPGVFFGGTSPRIIVLAEKS